MRSDREAPIRILDHIRDFFLYNDSSYIFEAEANLIYMWNRLSRWNDISVYKAPDGEVYPEILKAMIAIESYADEAEKRKSGGKKSYDL